MDYNNKEYVKDENVNVLKIFGVNNETAIELIESDELDSSINRFIEKRGEGLHHIALNIDNLENAITYLKSKDISLVYDKPKIGSNNSIITFIHPKSTPGILIELCQKM
jgi:methylmalonyl-CoA epimerase